MDIGEAPKPAAASYKSKPLTRLTRAEQERLSECLLAGGDFLTAETKAFVDPLNDLRAAQRIMELEGGAGYHAKVEAARPTVLKFMRAFREKMEAHRDDLRVAEIHPALIEDKAVPIRRLCKRYRMSPNCFRPRA